MNSMRLVLVIVSLICCSLVGMQLNCYAQSTHEGESQTSDTAPATADSTEPAGAQESVTSGSSPSIPLGDLVDYRAWNRTRRGTTPMIDAAVRMNTTDRDISRWRDRAPRGGNASGQSSDSRYATQSVTDVPAEEEEEGTSGGGGLFGSIFGDIAGLSGTQAELRNVRNRMSQLVTPLQNLRHPINSLKEPIDSLRNPISNLEEPLRGMREPISDLKQPLTELKQPMSDLKQPLTDLRQPMLDLKEGLQKPITGLQKPLSDLNLGTRQLSAPLNRMTSEINQLQSPMASIGQPLQGLASPMKGLPEPIHQLSGNVAALKTEVGGLHSELGDLRQSIFDISRNISFAVIVASFVIGASVIISRKVASKHQPTKTVVEQVVEDRAINMAPPEEHSHLSGPGPYDIAPSHGGPIVPPSVVAEHGHGRRDHVVKTVMKTIPIPEEEVEEEEEIEREHANDSKGERRSERVRSDFAHGQNKPRAHERKGEDHLDRDRFH